MLVACRIVGVLGLIWAAMFVLGGLLFTWTYSSSPWLILTVSVTVALISIMASRMHLWAVLLLAGYCWWMAWGSRESGIAIWTAGWTVVALTVTILALMISGVLVREHI